MTNASANRMSGCNLCGQSDWRTLEQVNGTRVVRCTCGLVFVTPQPPPSDLQTCYGEAYYTPWDQQDRLRRMIWTRRLATVRAVMPPPGRLLDVGCGTGTFLHLARGDGWDVTGTEFSAYACGVARAEGLSVHEGEVWDAKLPAQSFDVVTSWHVIEHVADPRRVLEECSRLLRPGGWLFLATPNLHDHFFQAAYLATRARRPPLFEPDEREPHLYFFDPDSLRRLAAGTGLQVVRVGFDRGAAAVWSKRLIEEVAHLWFRVTGVHWGMGLELHARKPTGGEEPR